MKKASLMAALIALAALSVAGAGTARACEDGANAHWLSDDGQVLVMDDHDGDFYFVSDSGHLGIASGGKDLQFIMGDADGAYLGVTLAEVDEESAKDAGIESGSGAMIRSVFDDTPAEKSGLEAGDVVVKFDGRDVRGVDDFMSMIREHEPGDEVEIQVRREGDLKRIKVELAKRDESFSIMRDPSMRGFRMPHMNLGDLQGTDWSAWGGSRGTLGVQVRDLDEDLAEYFPGTKQGALVLEVLEDTPAAEAGLKAGDVIVSLGGDEIADASDLREAVSDAQGDEGVELKYIRKGKTETIKVELPESPHKVLIRELQNRDDDERIVQRYRLREDDLEKKLEKLEQKLEQLEKKIDRRN